MSSALPKQNDLTKVITSWGVLSYPNLFKPRSVRPGEEQKYSVAFILDVTKPEGKACFDRLRGAVWAAGRDRWKDFDNMVQQKRVRMPFHRGEEKADSNGYGPGKIFFNCNSNQPPGVVDPSNNPVIDPGMVYPGVIARLSLRAFAYDQKGNKGVSFGLNNVQTTGKGDNIGGRARPQDDFDPIGEDDPVFGGGGSSDDVFN